jgi:hypothetical protein
MLVILVLALLPAVAAACGGDSAGQEEAAPPPAVNTSAPVVDPMAQAAAEATAIVQQAQATALVMQAEAQAAAMIEEASGPEQAGDGGEQPPGQEITPAEATATPPAGGQGSPSATATRKEPSVEIISVGFAGEGGFIHVQFMATPSLARRWNQGLVSVTDEETGIEYTEIPIMPVVGALIGKPLHEGQPGYVMLVNAPVPLKAGARVTVKLGDYIEEGLIVHG